MLKKTKCSHCVRLFQPIRVGHLYCSDTCRKLQFKAKNRAEARKKSNRRIGEKLIKLSSSSFGKYLVKEIKRAGTVQILHGHTFDSLTDLVKLRRKCTASSGYDRGESLGAYELSHIFPACGGKTGQIGLLHPSNLTIAPKAFNRKHSNKTPLCGYQGSSISREVIQPAWSIRAGDESINILKLARKYIGEDFDSWLKKHLITYTQKQALIRVLKEVGLPARILNEMSLKQLKDIAAEEELPYFDVSKEPEDIRHVLSEELNRLGIGSELARALELLAEYDWSLDAPSKEFIGTAVSRKKFEEFVIEQSLACLHGQPHQNIWGKKAVLKCFKAPQREAYKPYLSDLEEIPL